ncbi:MAG: DUF481 domain-containing protein [Pseudomonadota bacterium]
MIRMKTPLLLLALIAAPGLTLADRLVMNNGDILSGTIKSIADGKVTIEPPYGDAFAVSLDQVETLDSDVVFEVSLADAEDEVTGTIELDETGGQVLVIDERASPIDLAAVAGAAEPKPRSEWNARADLNVTSNSGNTDSQNTLIFTEGNYRLGENRHHADLTFRREEQDSVQTKEQDLLNYTYQRLFYKTWFFGGSFTYERDPIRELDHRYVLGADLGRDFIDRDGRFLSASVGVGYSDEELAGVTENGAVGLWRLRYTQDLWDDKVDFFHNHNITQQFYGNDNLIFKSNTGFRFDITDNYYANFSLRYDYETEPAAGASEDDSTVVVGLGAKF